MSNFRNACLKDELPFDKFEKYGAQSLSDAELLAIMLRTGTRDKNPVEVGREVLQLAGGKWGLLGLHHFTVDELMRINGIGSVKAIQLLCIAEIAKRTTQMQMKASLSFNNPESVAAYYMEQMRHHEKEHLMLVLLDHKGNLINDRILSVGTVDSTLISVREIFFSAIKENASGLIIMHNHPSGDSTPSRQDQIITKKIKEVSEMIEIPFLDHIIIGDNQYTSFKEKGLL